MAGEGGEAAVEGLARAALVVALVVALAGALAGAYAEDEAAEGPGVANPAAWAAWDADVEGVVGHEEWAAGPGEEDGDLVASVVATCGSPGLAVGKPRDHLGLAAGQV